MNQRAGEQVADMDAKKVQKLQKAVSRVDATIKKLENGT